MNSIVILLTIIQLISISSTFGEQTVSVRIKNGLIEGKRESFDGKDLDVFRGIPYAQPPVGPLRFKKPLPVSELTETVDAKEWPNSCIHNRFSLEEDFHNPNMSEDCLYLNIWSPKDSTSDDSLKPVFFFIHGGGLTTGSSVEKFYSGQVLAAKGDIVVVTINYRLDIFGFLYTGTDDAPGNVGLWDQALALEWVNDNIQYFGGDPKRITIAGESAGAFSVSMHMMSPTGRHLFKNAIIMSGVSTVKKGFCEKESLIKLYKNYAKSIDCFEDKDSERTDRFSNKLIDCLKNKQAKDFEFPPLGPGPDCIVPLLNDGNFLPDSPIEMMDRNDIKQNLSVLLGTTQDEGTFLIPFGVGGDRFDKYNPPHVELAGASHILKHAFESMAPGISEIIENVASVYLNGLPQNASSEQLLKAIGIGLGDFALGCPTILFGKKLIENNPNTKVYQYYFNSKASVDSPFCAKWMGVCHFDDIYPLFGLPFIDYNNYLETERRVSQEMIQIFSTFVKTGRPKGQTSGEWVHYNKIDDKIFAPFYEISDKYKTLTHFGVGLKITECEILFKKYLLN